MKTEHDILQITNLNVRFIKEQDIEGKKGQKRIRGRKETKKYRGKLESRIFSRKKQG